MAPVNFSVGDRAIHTNWMYGAEHICTIQDIRGPVECGGVFKGEVETYLATVRFANGRHANATLGTLKPYETPKYPPGVIPAKFYLDCLEEPEKLKTTSWRRGQQKKKTTSKKK